MTMKSGAGDDPFADTDNSAEDDGESDEADHAVDTDAAASTPADPADTSASDSADQSPADQTSPEIPRIMARSSVKEDRDSVLQFFVTDETAQQEDDFERAVADELDIRVKDLMKLDLREAAYLVAMQHPEETAEILNDWGYEYR